MADLNCPYDDTLVDAETASRLGRAVIGRAIADAGLSPGEGRRNQCGITPGEKRDAIRFLTSDHRYFSSARNLVADLAGLDGISLRERVTKALGGPDAVAALLARPPAEAKAARDLSADHLAKLRVNASIARQAQAEKRARDREERDRLKAERAAARVAVEAGADAEAHLGAATPGQPFESRVYSTKPAAVSWRDYQQRKRIAEETGQPFESRVRPLSTSPAAAKRRDYERRKRIALKTGQPLARVLRGRPLSQTAEAIAARESARRYRIRAGYAVRPRATAEETARAMAENLGRTNHDSTGPRIGHPKAEIVNAPVSCDASLTI